MSPSDNLTATEVEDTEAGSVHENEVESAVEHNGIEEEGETEPEIVENEVTFKFRKPKGETDETKIRQPVTLKLPFLTWNGVAAALSSEDPKVVNYIIDIVNDVIRDAALEQVNDPEKPVNSQDDLDDTKLTLEYLANVIKERKSSGISKEDWQDFKTDYIAVMPELTGKDKDKVERAAALFVGRFQAVKTSKKIIETLVPMLVTWYDSKDDEAKGKYAPIYEFLTKKAEEFLAVSDEDMLKNLV